MQNEALLENKEIIMERLERFKSRLDGIASGERVFVRTLESDEYVEITPNVIVRYRWMVEICDFTIFLLDDKLMREAAERPAFAGKLSGI
ncbi:hypothetical protein [Rhizobium leucaenae]|uniref:hypothetical protein n=1 Tax=Rhizobium leucaenae TaxID=29450 RepID=UPI0007EE614F|nr:hypothetical protein [Rhizobium leucaenae]MBB6303773.1 hypothetical protein [Rhizobium leucaenae]